ncbi:aspartate kinase [Tellurirhabdus rosea]|uniref:aspartate kinase n=1 Tax=Tellurirhabdus rosea TaxID=2674997 RepID=UPI00225A7126|nr:aspartate kinase [Tellurirhabdus rosea]
MQVFKFGGASVKDAASVRNVSTIIRREPARKLVVVVSAMGKTTNALEELTWAYLRRDEEAQQRFWQQVRNYHESIMQELAAGEQGLDFGSVYDSFAAVEAILEDEPDANPDLVYDQLVSFGEVISTQIVNAYLNATGLDSIWVDARRLIRTDNSFREGNVRWDRTCTFIEQTLLDLLHGSVVITQGFVGGTTHGETTTLGREGSDYSAAIFAHCLNAKGVTIWKDVPGVLNADPKWFDETVLIEQLSYQDAIELAYYGATVIHPKTIKPLQNKNIPLWVRSFVNPDARGTVIGPFTDHLRVPSFIFKMDQMLISLHPRDFSFIAEDNLSRIFGVFADMGVRINLMQNTAISFSVSIDNKPDKVPALLERLKEDFRVTYNEGLELITIRYYDEATIDRVLTGKRMLLEQKSRYTVQLVVKNL